MTLSFFIEGGSLLLRYSPQHGNSWIFDGLTNDTPVRIKGGIFTFAAQDLYESSAHSDFTEDDPVVFKIGERVGEYFKINSKVLSIDFDLYFHETLNVTRKMFIAVTNISVFGVIGKLGIRRLAIGGNDNDSMPIKAFYELISKIPSRYELNKYVLARVSSTVRNFISTKHDAESQYLAYLDKKQSFKPSTIIASLKEYEQYKFNYLLEKLTAMLDAETEYSEKSWQSEILIILRLLFPKYIGVFSGVALPDSVRRTEREIDYLLVDSDGNVDIAEIKKPFEKCIMTEGMYRDNYIPLRELSGTVMQVEKYIYHLTRWGATGEDKLTERYKASLSDGLTVKITSPNGIIIMGRDSNLSQTQRADFEIIRRQYKSVLDIMTYDDLLRRLRLTIEQFRMTP